ncbi:hypothetical protein [Nocardia anaemiae]|nr:hypothetical protein [Nocardia anaemiae]
MLRRTDCVGAHRLIVADAVTTTDGDFESAVEKITGLLDENGNG